MDSKILKTLISHRKFFYLGGSSVFLVIIAWSFFFSEPSDLHQLNRMTENKHLTYDPNNLPVETNSIDSKIEYLNQNGLIFEPNLSNSGEVQLDHFYFIEEVLQVEKSQIDEAITFAQKERLRKRFKMMLRKIVEREKVFSPDERIILEELKRF